MGDFEYIKEWVEFIPRDVKHLEFGLNHENKKIINDALDELQDDVETLLQAVKRLKEENK